MKKLASTVARLTKAGFKVKDTPKLREEAETLRLRWLRSLLAQIDRRFPQVELFTALSELFNPAAFPTRDYPGGSNFQFQNLK